MLLRDIHVVARGDVVLVGDRRVDLHQVVHGRLVAVRDAGQGIAALDPVNVVFRRGFQLRLGSAFSANHAGEASRAPSGGSGTAAGSEDGEQAARR